MYAYKLPFCKLFNDLLNTFASHDKRIATGLMEMSFAMQIEWTMSAFSMIKFRILHVRLPATEAEKREFQLQLR